MKQSWPKTNRFGVRQSYFKLFSHTVYSDFRTIKGIPIAFKSQVYVKDKIVMEDSVKKIEVNPGVDMNLFKIEGNK